LSIGFLGLIPFLIFLLLLDFFDPPGDFDPPEAFDDVVL
jgi:hypothetical protein